MNIANSILLLNSNCIKRHTKCAKMLYSSTKVYHMILSKEMILTLTCLKTVGVKGVGPKKIFSIGKIIANEGSNVKDVKDLLSIMERMNEKVIKEITLGQLERAYDHSRRIIEASKIKNANSSVFMTICFRQSFVTQ